jgi:transposase-like protein
MRGSAQLFLRKAIRNNGKPRVVNIDKSGANKSSISRINRNLLTVLKIRIRQYKILEQYSGIRPPQDQEANFDRHGLQGV